MESPSFYLCRSSVRLKLGESHKTNVGNLILFFCYHCAVQFLVYRHIPRARMSIEGYVLIFGAGRSSHPCSYIWGLPRLTSAGSGIGRETGYTFAERGATGICFADIDTKAAQDAADVSKKLATNAEYQAIAISVDVTDRSSVRAVVTATQELFGRIDFNINSAGV